MFCHYFFPADQIFFNKISGAKKAHSTPAFLEVRITTPVSQQMDG
jgi:hypothetical protein